MENELEKGLVSQSDAKQQEKITIYRENMVIRECSKPAWYMLRTFVNQEQKALNNLQRQLERYGLENKIVEVFSPKEHVITLENNTTKHDQNSFFPGFIFVAFDVKNDLEIHDVANLFLRDKKTLCRATAAEIKRMKDLEAKSSQAPTATMDLKPGQHVRVIEGSYLNMTGTIDKVDFEQKKVVVKLEIFGRESSVNLELDQVATDSEFI